MKKRHALEGIIIRMCDFLCTSIFSEIQHISPGSKAKTNDFFITSISKVIKIEEYKESKHGLLPVGFLYRDRYVVSICLLCIFSLGNFLNSFDGIGCLGILIS